MRTRNRTRFVLALGLAVASSRGLAQIGAPVANWKAPGAPAAPPARTAGKGTMTDLTSPMPFIAVAPCRVVDTRGPAGPYGAPALETDVPRSFVLPVGPCPGIPTTAAAFSLNVTVVSPSGAGFLVLYPQGAAQPLVSTLNYLAGQTLANAAIVAAGPGGGITVESRVASSQLLIDINGYFAGGVVTRLNAGPGVALSGTGGVITVGIANGGVGLPQLSAAGSAPGQSLTSNGGTVVWGNPLNFTGLLAGDVTGPQGATVVSAATSTNTPNGIVRRDANGSFSAGAVSLSGDLTLGGGASLFQGPNLLLHTSGSESVFLGLSAASLASRGSQDTAVGVLSLSANVTGDDNSAFGWASLVANNTGSLNTAVGAFSLANLASGNENTAIGQQALHHTLGSRNIGLGSFAGFNLTAGNDNIDIGNTGIAGEASTIRIGTAQTRTFLAGVRGVQTGMADALDVVIDSQGQLGMINSSAAAKRDIHDVDDASKAVLKLRPVLFFYRNDEVGIRQYGLVAEEVASVFPELVQFSPSGKAETVRYHFLPPLLLSELQKQSREIQALEETVDAQHQRIRALESRLSALERPGSRAADRQK